MPTPTPAQKRLLQALIDNGGSGYPGRFGKTITVRACRANGWIKQVPALSEYEVPPYAVTAEGRAAVERKARPAAERAKIAQDARSANARQRKLDAMASELRKADYLVYSRAEVIEMLKTSMHRNGISAAWLQGYLDIDKSEIATP